MEIKRGLSTCPTFSGRAAEAGIWVLWAVSERNTDNLLRGSSDLVRRVCSPALALTKRLGVP